MSKGTIRRALRVYARGITEEQVTRLLGAWGGELDERETALMNAVDALAHCEESLARAALHLVEEATRTQKYIGAEPGEPVYPLRTLGQTADDYNRQVGVHEGLVRLVQTLWELGKTA